MRYQGRMEVMPTYLGLQCCQPLDEKFLRVRCKTESRGILHVQLQHPTKNPRHLLFRRGVRRAVYGSPCRIRLRPNQQLKPLNQTVVAWTVFEGVSEI